MLSKYSRRHPYWWGQQDCKAILDDAFKEAGLKYCKQEFNSDGERHSLYYYNISCAFDIEDSSFFEYDHYISEAIKTSVMYVWQFGIDNVVIMGRTWSDFVDLFTYINTKVSPFHRVIVYVHYLDHEFQFMRKWLQWDRVFSRKMRSPIYAISGGVEFRDSYILSGKSLVETAKDIRTNKNMRKKIGDLDYSKIRGCTTHLTRKEIGYCMADVQILCTYINEKIEDEHNIGKIPLTKTGYVRRYVRKQCLPTKKSEVGDRIRYFDGIHKLTLQPTEYKMLKRAFQGGFTHANALYVGEHLKGRIDSIDFTSSYPACILGFPFPASAGKEVKVKDSADFNKYLDDYLSIFVIQFNNIREKENVYDNIISSSKCWDVIRGVYNNGRLVSAIQVTTCMSNIDFESVQKFYDFASFKIGRMYIYEKGYLPKPIIESVLEFYRAKTELKGVISAELEYRIKKEMLNSVY